MKTRNSLFSHQMDVQRCGRSFFTTVSASLNAPALIILSLLLCLSAHAAQARTLRVQQDGAGDFASVQAAVNAMASGDVCIVGAGNYAERIVFPSGKSGRAGALTTIKAETPGSAQLLGFNTDNCGYLRIEGFSISAPSSLAHASDGIGILIRSSNVEIISNYLHDLPQAGISGAGNSVKIRGNHAFKCGTGIIISGSGWQVEGNKIERLQKFPTTSLVDHIRFRGTDHVFRNNHLLGTVAAETGGLTVGGFQMFDGENEPTRHIVIENNLLEGLCRNGIKLGAGNRLVADDIAVRNNLFIGPTDGAIDAARAVQGLMIFNNTIVNPGRYGIRVREQSGAEVKNNVFFSEKSSLSDSEAIALTYVADATSSVTGEKNLVCIPGKPLKNLFPNDITTQTPPFVSLKSRNYRLRPGGPGIDQGASLSGFNTDREGMIRPQGSAWDVGAYEFPHSHTNRPSSPINLRISVK